MAEMDKFVEEQKHDGVTIELTVNEVNVVLGALAELPHRVSDPVIRKVFTQAQQQLQAQ
jgi:hypothetical protein